MIAPREVRASPTEGTPRAKSRWTFWALVLAALIAAMAYPVPGDVASGAGGAARIGSPAPDFTLRLFTGERVTLSSLKGKPVLVSFWHSG